MNSSKESGVAVEVADRAEPQAKKARVASAELQTLKCALCQKKPEERVGKT